MFYDDGIQNPNPKWDTLYVTRSVESNGTKFLVTTTNASARASMNPLDNNTAYDFDAVPFVWEFDLVGYNSDVGGVLQAQVIQATPTTLNKSFSLKNELYIGKPVKITYDGSKLEFYVDETKISETTVTYDSSNKVRIGFSFNQKDDYLIVKNVKLYPI